MQARTLPRLAQLTSERPHLINRYVSLLAFAKTAVPDQFRRFRDDLTHDTQAKLDRLMLPFERETPAAAGFASAGPLILVISAALVVAALIAVLVTGGIGPGTGPVPVPTPTPSFTLPAGSPT